MSVLAFHHQFSVSHRLFAVSQSFKCSAHICIYIFSPKLMPEMFKLNFKFKSLQNWTCTEMNLDEWKIIYHLFILMLPLWAVAFAFSPFSLLVFRVHFCSTFLSFLLSFFLLFLLPLLILLLLLFFCVCWFCSVYVTKITGNAIRHVFASKACVRHQTSQPKPLPFLHLSLSLPPLSLEG